MRRVRVLLAVVSAALVMVAGCGSGGATYRSGPSGSTLAGDPNDLFNEVSGQDAYVHLRALQRIADANHGTRVTGSSGYAASVAYVVTVLRDAGYQVSTPTVRVNLDGQGLHGETAVQQVIAQTSTGDPNRVVMAGAHLDSVQAGPGIDDNGSGVAALLDIAQKLGGSPGVHNAVRFAFWGAEEEHDAGSVAYVNQLSDAERRKIMLYINTDMVASANGGYFVQGGQDQPSGSASVAQELTKQLARTGIDAGRYKFDGESDYEGFVDHDIPSGGVLTSGDEDSLTDAQAREWGGQADEDIAPYTHTAGDTLAHIDRTLLNNFTRALAGTIDHFSMSSGGL